MEQNQNKGPKNDGPKNKQSLLVLVICLMFGLLFINLFSFMTRNQSNKIPYKMCIRDRWISRGISLWISLSMMQ